MLLEDIELRSEEMDKAMDDGIKTLHDYTIWYIGYMSGYRQRQKEVMKKYRGL